MGNERPRPAHRVSLEMRATRKGASGCGRSDPRRAHPTGARRGRGRGLSPQPGDRGARGREYGGKSVARYSREYAAAGRWALDLHGNLQHVALPRVECRSTSPGRKRHLAENGPDLVNSKGVEARSEGGDGAVDPERCGEGADAGRKGVSEGARW